MEHTFKLVIHESENKQGGILEGYYDGKYINKVEYDEQNGKYTFTI